MEPLKTLKKIKVSLIKIMDHCLYRVHPATIFKKVNFKHFSEEKLKPKSVNIGLLVTATGRYAEFVEQLVESARLHFCPTQNVTFYIFTDGKIPEANDIVRIEQPRLGWPHDTLKRFEIYLNHAEIFRGTDFLFCTDADMRFVDLVGEEILWSLVATQHPGFVNLRGSYETKKCSSAAVNWYEGARYYCGGFYGGKRDELLNLFRVCSSNINQDLEKDYIALWHDESHINRYFIDFPPTQCLTPAYCYPENWNIPYSKKLLALDKNHSKLRF